MEDMKVKFDTKKLDALIEALKDKVQVKVGIVGPAQAREDGNDNATIGAKHEFGDPLENLPIRSFLRMPISMFMQPRVESARESIIKTFEEALEAKTLRPVMETVGAIGKGLVLEAFATEGFGKWAKHSPNYQNQTGMVLQDTQSLKKSINYAVVEKE